MEPNPKQLAVLNILKKMQNQYWLIANNAIVELLQKVPEFTVTNPEAQPSIKAWLEFRNDPCTKTFDHFIDTIKYYGRDPKYNSVV